MKEIKIIRTIDEMKEEMKILRGKKVGFVPTMGYLHKGHSSLINKASIENNVVVVSIFVNPIQFGVNEDLDKYPKDLENDIKIVRANGGDIIFCPDVREMYPSSQEAFVDISDELGKKLCGKQREGHFKGVMTVVTKLFNIVEPENAYFGQKDMQQLMIINKMVKDLNMNVNIIGCPIVREKDGLALSSRNSYLNKKEREEAIILYQALELAKKEVYSGEKNVKKLLDIVKTKIKESSLANIDYVEILDSENLKDIEKLEKKSVLALAVKFGKTRLIDNCFLEG